jgi:hypothetical protein
VAIGDHAIDLLEYAQSGRLETVSKAFGDIEFDHVFGQVSLPVQYQYKHQKPTTNQKLRITSPP